MNDKNNKSTKVKEFKQRLDFYWQSISAYAIVLIVYSLLMGSIEEGTFSLTLQDPIVILLSIFIIVASISLLYSFSRKRSLVIGDDNITFKNRIGEKQFSIDEIECITIGRDGMLPSKNVWPVVKIKLSSRRRILRIRTNFFLNPDKLIKAITKLKNTIECK